MAMNVLQLCAPAHMLENITTGLDTIVRSHDSIPRQKDIARQSLAYLQSRGGECSMLDLYMVQATVNGGLVLIKKNPDIRKEAVMQIPDVA